MSLSAASYFDHLRAYLSDAYVVDDGASGSITLTEKYFREGETKKSTRKVMLPFQGRAFAIKLDGRMEPLFHFLDDNGKQWSKRCDFIVFQCNRRCINAHLFEFKTRSLEAQSIIDQLKSGVNWCASVRKIINQYTGDDREMRVRKFVITENDRPAAYLDAAGKYLARDPSIRHYHYDDLSGLTLDTLDNTSIRTV
ncbi:hypothetical protein [Acidisphaera sp. L21]|uniref:hypothetical protein n=1 Tax=Acidisphaera sp. L21 TaxID=1641851 RepID=UPI00131CCB4D|nr:hypothetical protein [Acidisphaera sp. L21]